MASCAVKCCKNNRRLPPRGKVVSFHVFPRGRLQRVWWKLLGYDGEVFAWSKNRVICSEHFKEDDIIYCAQTRHLKYNAVPSQKLYSEDKPVSQELDEKPFLETTSIEANMEQNVQFIKSIHSYSLWSSTRTQPSATRCYAK